MAFYEVIDFSRYFALIVLKQNILIRRAVSKPRDVNTVKYQTPGLQEQ